MNGGRAPARRKRPRWESWPTADLLGLPLNRLGLALEGTPLEARVTRVAQELARRGLRFRPHVWLSSDFFSPDGVPGLAVPFYLAHPRLIHLERSQMLFAEGASERECLRLLRHEAGHAIDTAFHLHRRADWRAAFGRRSAPYRRHYVVDPASRSFVHYLPRWYAQSHPAEDFAETFAVWLDPGSRWRSRYSGRDAARAKLELVDGMMAELVDTAPRVRRRERTESLAGLTETLGRHYAAKQRRFAGEPRAPFEPALARVCAPGARSLRSPAGTHIARLRAEIAARVRGRFAGDRYSTDQVIDAMVHRARELGLRLKPGRSAPTLRSLAGMVRITLEELQRGNHRLCR